MPASITGMSESEGVFVRGHLSIPQSSQLTDHVRRQISEDIFAPKGDSKFRLRHSVLAQSSSHFYSVLVTCVSKQFSLMTAGMFAQKSVGFLRNKLCHEQRLIIGQSL